MPKLEIIGSASVGYDGIPVEYARSKGIPVTNTPEVLNDDVADLAIALMIMTARKLVAIGPLCALQAAGSSTASIPWRHAPAASGSASWAWAASARKSASAPRR